MACDIWMDLYEKKGDKSYKKVENFKDFEGRSYLLFSILAGVRNNGEVDEPIQEQRGLPDGLSWDNGQKGILNGVNLGDHSYGYVTIQEILDYKYWDNITYYYGEEETFRSACEFFWNFLNQVIEENKSIKPNDLYFVMGFD